jgi:hypothetical protein
MVNRVYADAIKLGITFFCDQKVRTLLLSVGYKLSNILNRSYPAQTWPYDLISFRAWEYRSTDSLYTFRHVKQQQQQKWLYIIKKIYKQNLFLVNMNKS